MTRRETVRNLALWAAGSPLALAQPTSEKKLADLINVFDFDAACATKVSKTAYDYVSGGSWDEWSVQHNRDAFHKIVLLPRMLVEVDKLDLSTELFGLKLPMPVLVAPTGTHSVVHPDGELATVRGAGAAGALMVVSTSSSFPLDQIAAAATGPLWFQLYTGPDKQATESAWRTRWGSDARRCAGLSMRPSTRPASGTCGTASRGRRRHDGKGAPAPHLPGLMIYRAGFRARSIGAFCRN